MIAVTGSTGQLGRLVINSLKAKVPAGQIVALARSPEKIADLGVETRLADYDKPEILRVALKGIDRLILISSNEVGQRTVQHQNIIAAAKAVGVKQIIYTSLLNAETSGISLADEHRTTEADLVAAGIPYVILRNGWYLENYGTAIDGALASGTVMGSAGAGRIAAAARADFAEAAAVIATTPDHEGKIYELGGDVPFTLGELADTIARLSGKPVNHADLPEADYASALVGIGLGPDLAAMVAGWDVAIADGALDDSSRTLSKLIGRPTTTLADYVSAHING
jgi:NAD(P)H dehydrogenase (quinone)